VQTVLSPVHPPGTPTGFRWDLDSGQPVESIRLHAPRGQAYTMTVVGPDGTSYAIEDATLYAVGS
jgi:hypothetical protein